MSQTFASLKRIISLISLLAAAFRAAAAVKMSRCRRNGVTDRSARLVVAGYRRRRLGERPGLGGWLGWC